MKSMKQGTISVIVGCHSQVHSLLVWLAWMHLYHKIPSPRQTVCIILHDIGHWGKDYLDDVDAKHRHWELGAKIAGKLFGSRYYELCAGHDAYSGYARSELYKADKYSWYIAPYWWIYSNNIVEPKIKCGMKNWDAVLDFKKNVKASIESGQYNPTHDLFEQRKAAHALKEK